MVPYIALLIFLNPKFFAAKMIFSLIAQVTLVITQTASFTWVFGFESMRRMLLSVVFAPAESLNVNMYVSEFYSNLIPLDHPFILTNSIFVISMIVFLVLTFPKSIEKPLISVSEKAHLVSPWTINLQLFLSIIIAAVPILLYLYSYTVYGA